MESLWEAVSAYKLVITRRSASEILLLPNSPAWELPRIAIHPQQRIAEHLTTEVRRTWGLEAYCLSFPAPRQGEDARCAVMECVRHNDRAPAGTCWAPRQSAADGAEAQEGRLIRQSLEELDVFVKEEKAGPFARPGWLRELFMWVREQLEPSGLRLTGGFRQLNASPTFSLICIEADVGAVWFKATGEPNSHELPVTLALAKLFPHFVPRILGVHRAWNGWLSAGVPGVPLDEITDCLAWEAAARTLAELQIASIEKGAELLKAQFKDLRIRKLAKRIDPFVARMGELMAVQETDTPARLVESELRTLAERLKEACALLESLGLPDTLGHIDFNPGNILVSGDCCVFLDWAEGCVTNPLVTFEYLCEHRRRSGIKGSASREQLVSAYLEPWTARHSRDDWRRALALSPLLAVFACAVANDSWRSANSRHIPTQAGYFRSLARRMYRESIHAAMGSELCLD